MAFDPRDKLYEAEAGYGVAVLTSTGITSTSSLQIQRFHSDLRVDNGRAT